MKCTNSCPKCQNAEIAKIEGGGFKGNTYNIISFGLTTVYLTRYVCTYCGYTENYVDDKKDLDKIKNKFFKSEDKNDFV